MFWIDKTLFVRINMTLGSVNNRDVHGTIIKTPFCMRFIQKILTLFIMYITVGKNIFVL